MQSFGTIYRPSSSPFDGPVDPEVLAVHGVMDNEVNPSPLDSAIFHSTALGYFSEYGHYRYSERAGFLIYNVPFKPVDELLFPSTTEDGVVLASRYNSSALEAYDWHTQLEHRGLPTTGTIEIAKVRLLCAGDEVTLTSEVSEIKNALILHLHHILSDPRRGYKYPRKPELTFCPRELIEDPAGSAVSSICNFAASHPSPTIDGTILDTAAFVGRFELAYFPDRSHDRPSPAGELVLAFDPDSNHLFGRFRLPGDRRAPHGLVRVVCPRALSTARTACDVARETTRANWNVTHGSDETYVEFVAARVIVLGKGFWAPRVPGREGDGRVGQRLVGVKLVQGCSGFGDQLHERVGGVTRPDLFRRMWEDVHERFCGEGGGC